VARSLQQADGKPTQSRGGPQSGKRMTILRNGWTWAGFLLVVMLWPRPAPPVDLSGDLRTCQTVQTATEAHVGGLMLQNMVIETQAKRMAGEIERANQWRAGAMHAISVLELRCRAVMP
jgi:hypothetical protein